MAGAPGACLTASGAPSLKSRKSGWAKGKHIPTWLSLLHGGALSAWGRPPLFSQSLGEGGLVTCLPSLGLRILPQLLRSSPQRAGDRLPLTSPARPGPWPSPHALPSWSCSPRAEQMGRGAGPGRPQPCAFRGDKGHGRGQPWGDRGRPGTRGPRHSPPGGCGKGRPHPPAFQTRCTPVPK